MQEYLRRGTARWWGWLRRQRDRWAAQTAQDAEAGRWIEARARFWNDLREGQREAEARHATQTQR
jgi:hypothetical protein